MAKHLKHRAETNPACGRPPAERGPRERVEWGVVPLDKPSGPTSREAADAVRGALGAGKAGHGGTLDPKVTGVLPVLLDRATKAASVLLGCDKAYRGTMMLHDEVAEQELDEAVDGFRGTIRQKPPRRSRVKREFRERTVYSFRIERFDGRRAVFAVRCEGGTYVRKLIHDLGVQIGCGAHMTALRRAEAAGIGLSDCVSMEEVEQAGRALQRGESGPLERVLRPVEDVVTPLLPVVVLDDGAIDSVCTGYPLAVPGICELDDFAEGDRVAVLTLKGELVGLGEALADSAEVLEAEHGEAVHVGQVMMRRGTYPADPE